MNKNLVVAFALVAIGILAAERKLKALWQAIATNHPSDIAGNAGTKTLSSSSGVVNPNVNTRKENTISNILQNVDQGTIDLHRRVVAGKARDPSFESIVFNLPVSNDPVVITAQHDFISCYLAGGSATDCIKPYQQQAFPNG